MSKGVIVDDDEVGGEEEAIAEEEIVVEIGTKEPNVKGVTWTGRSERERGFPKTSSPLSRMANKQREKFEI